MPLSGYAVVAIRKALQQGATFIFALEASKTQSDTQRILRKV